MAVPAIDPVTLAQWLSEARTAYHKLQIGRLSVEVMVDGTQTVRFNRANAGDLVGYISRLEAQLAGRAILGAVNVIF